MPKRSVAGKSERSRILGVDPSLTSTGYAYYDKGKIVSGRITTSPLKGPYRLCYIRNSMGRILDVAKPSLIVYEDYAMGARGNNMFHMGELGGVLKTLFWERGIDYLTIPPTVMKSVIALDGRAEKQGIANALRVRFGIHVEQHDEADAIGLMLLGEMRSGARKATEVVGKSDRFQAVRDCSITKGRLQLISNPR